MRPQNQTQKQNQSTAKKRPPKPDSQDKTSPTLETHPSDILQRAELDPESLTPHDMRQLQRTIGNQRTGQLLAKVNPGQSPDGETPSFSPRASLQRMLANQPAVAISTSAGTSNAPTIQRQLQRWQPPPELSTLLYYEDTRALDELFEPLGGVAENLAGWYLNKQNQKIYYYPDGQYYVLESGQYWDPVSKRTFTWDGTHLLADDGSGIYEYRDGYYVLQSAYPPGGTSYGRDSYGEESTTSGRETLETLPTSYDTPSPYDMSSSTSGIPVTSSISPEEAIAWLQENGYDFLLDEKTKKASMISLIEGERYFSKANAWQLLDCWNAIKDEPISPQEVNLDPKTKETDMAPREEPTSIEPTPSFTWKSYKGQPTEGAPVPLPTDEEVSGNLDYYWRGKGGEMGGGATERKLEKHGENSSSDIEFALTAFRFARANQHNWFFQLGMGGNHIIFHNYGQSSQTKMAVWDCSLGAMVTFYTIEPSRVGDVHDYLVGKGMPE